MFIPRIHHDLEKFLQPNRVLVIFGPRQAGKTTLIKDFISRTNFKFRLDTGDDITVQEQLGSQNLAKIKEYASGYELIVIDEAQRIPNVGIGLKLAVDNIPGIRILVTGSSSFELAGQVGEPLTGRKRTYMLYPLAQSELAAAQGPYDVKQQLPAWLVFGSYPAVVAAAARADKIAALNEITNSYLLKDILELEKVKGAKVLLDLLRLLAFQIGSEVSLTELGSHLRIDYKTVARYLDLLEKAFVLFNLRGFSRNLRKEVSKMSKYYFYDVGIRNAVISNFNDLELRDDVGKLWENFLVAERLKVQNYRPLYANNYFWRTWDKKEIDWIEEREGRLFGYEFTFTNKGKRIPKEFVATYPTARGQVITKNNYDEFVGICSPDDAVVEAKQE